MPSPEKFGQILREFGVSKEVTEKIYSGFEEIKDKSAKPERAAFLGQAVCAMNENLTKEQVKEILEAGACCKGGSRERNSKRFAKDNKELGLRARLELISGRPELYMGKAKLDEQGFLLVYAVAYQPKGKFECACPNVNQKKGDVVIPREYCYCCGGHFKHHYEIMLGVTLKLVEIVSSPHDTEGEKPCVFRYQIVEE